MWVDIPTTSRPRVVFSKPKSPGLSSRTVSVLVFPEKKGEKNKHHPRSGQQRAQPGNGTKKQNSVFTKSIPNTYFTVLSS